MIVSLGLIVLGIAVAVFGAVVMIKFPDLHGGTITIPIPFLRGASVTLTTRSAGLLLFLVGVGIAVGGLLLYPDDDDGGDVVLPNILLGMNRVGTAHVLSGGTVRLTDANGLQSGAVWTPNQFNVATPFRAEVEFKITRVHQKGSDGLAFVIQSHEDHALGLAGGGLGYQGIPRSIAVEFDTWQNLPDARVSGTDPSSNHIGIHTRGTAPNSADPRDAVVSSSDIPFLADSERHTATIRYDGRRLEVCIDDHEQCLRHEIDIPATIGSPEAWVGITSGSGNPDVADIHDAVRFYFKPGG